MSTQRCPSCGQPNPAEATECESCGFPLVEPAATTPGAQRPAGGRSASGGGAPPARPLPPMPRRPRRRPRRSDPTSTTLWIVFGGFAAMVVLWIAVQSTLKGGGSQPVEGSNQVQQATADSLARVLERDSTNVDAQQRLADLFYDTANWGHAIEHYRIALRLDSTRTSAMVDMGVCYFNLGDKQSAASLFDRALRHEPNQPVALFNLGIVAESREDYRTALDYFHRALQSNPPESMHTPLIQAIQRLEQKGGIQPPPLPGNTTPGTGGR
jgi:cytochrome c-type biogenesis protein CcmH/NrfG